MLRLYKPIKHPIFKLQAIAEELVCHVWCEADHQGCHTKMSADLLALYIAYGWLKEKVDTIYAVCLPLSLEEKEKIALAFRVNNQIQQLCKSQVAPIYLHQLPAVVEEDMKPLFVRFYEDLLEKAKVPGTKKDYYEKLIVANDFLDCPCCGLVPFEHVDSKAREAYDHYLPKSDYPFASVNFDNLVPLCYKCNSDRKKAKNPIENGRKTFYPFSNDQHQVQIDFTIDQSKDLRALQRKDVQVKLHQKVNEKQLEPKEEFETWDALFDIRERYNDTMRGFSKTFLRRIKRRHTDFKEREDNTWTYSDTLKKLIHEFEPDRFEDKRFLKIALMKELSQVPHLVGVYGNPEN